MCRSMVDIKSTATEIRRGKKEEDRKKPQVGVSTGTRASGYPLSNGYPGSKISARVGTVGPPVVINTSRLTKISAAMKSYTPRVVVALLSATEASHLSGRQGPMRWGELGGYVD